MFQNGFKIIMYTRNTTECIFYDFDVCIASGTVSPCYDVNFIVNVYYICICMYSVRE